MSSTGKKSKKQKKNPSVKSGKSATKIPRDKDNAAAAGGARGGNRDKLSPNSAEGSSGGASVVPDLLVGFLKDTPPPTKLPTPVKIEIPLWAKPPWPEWSDAIINRENWEENESVELFEDPTGTGIEPSSLKPQHWIRPTDLFLDPPVLVDWSRNTMDLVSQNAHLCEASELIRYILSEIAELYDFGMNTDFLIEGEDTAFVTNSFKDGISWKPWDHIYSCCKAGVKGERPKINAIGKYYVRLYYAGCWRRITVDDRIPLLKNGMMGVPLTDKNELWPMILTKALLKVARLTFDENNSEEVKTFSSITALTGWVNEWTELVEPMTGEGLWFELLELLPKYKLPPSAKRKQLLGEKPKKTEEVDDPDKFNWPNNTGDKDQEPAEYWENSDGEPDVQNNPDNISIDKVAALKLKVIKTKLRPSKERERKVEEGKNLQQEDSQISQKTDKSAKKSKKAKSTKSKSKAAGKDAADKEPDEGSSVKDKSKAKSKEAKDDKGKGSKKKKDANPSLLKVKSEASVRSASKKKSKKDKKKTMLETGYIASGEETDEEASGNEGTGKLKSLALWKNPLAIPPEPPKKVKIPLMNKILKAARNYLGCSDPTAMTALETSLGKNVPITLTTILQTYPEPEEEGVMIPSFLYHPMQIIEVRDVDLYKESNRPPTPRWKQYRWKAWAMKKGLIPMEKDPSTSDVRCIKMKTPFALKTDWDKLGSIIGFRYFETLGEQNGIEEIHHIDTAIAQRAISPTPDINATPPPAPPGTAVDICGSGNKEDNPDKDFPKPTTTPSIIVTNADEPDKRTVKDTTGGSKDKSKRSKTSSRGSEHGDHKKNHADGLSSDEWVGEASTAEHHEKSAAGTGNNSGMESDGEGLSNSGVVETVPEPPPPQLVCGTVWFESDKVAPVISKFCKYYGTRNRFGTTVVITRVPHHEELEDRKSNTTSTQGQETADAGRMALNSDFNEIAVANDASVAEQFQHLGTKIYRDYHAKPDSIHLTITFDAFKMMKLTPYHLLQVEGVDSAFYLFCDSWTSQEVIIQLDLLQERIVDSYLDKVIKSKEATPTGKEGEKVPEIEEINKDLHVTLVLEPWDWKKDCLIETPVLYHTSTSSWMTHINLPPGRHTFRLWVVEERNQSAVDDDEEEEEEAGDGSGEPTDEVRNSAWEYLHLSELLESKNSPTKESLRVVSNELDESGTTAGISDSPIGNSEDNPEAQETEMEETTDSQRTLIITPTRSGVPVKVAVPYTIKLISKTPIHVGSRDEVQKYLTNEPVLFLKQCEKLAQCFWNAFLLFGKSRKSTIKNLVNLRRTYCPHVESPDFIKSSLRQVHTDFEDYLVTFIKHMNNGVMDKKMLFTLRMLFLNPRLGESHEATKRRGSIKQGLTQVLQKLGKHPEVLRAIITIQKYCRGWLIRRLFQWRMKTNKKFLRYEYQVRKIAFLFAQNTEADFTTEVTPENTAIPKDDSKEQEPAKKDIRTIRSPDKPNEGSKTKKGRVRSPETQEEELPALTPIKPPSFSIVPNPPKWAVRMMKHLYHHHPLLVTIHPHATCLPHHVRIKDIEGAIPDTCKYTNWYPFVREIIHTPGESKLTYCMIELQTNPQDGMIMQLIDNDSHEVLNTITQTMFLGSLEPNVYGYTLVCYKMVGPPRVSSPYETPASKEWKIRIITPVVQNPIVFQKETDSHVHELHHHELLHTEIKQSIVVENSETIRQSQATENNVQRDAFPRIVEPLEQPANLLHHHDEDDGQHFHKVVAIPKNLRLRHFSGYYLPSQYHNVCNYTIITQEDYTQLSLRFKASSLEARFRLEVWDLNAGEVLYELNAVGEFLVPSITIRAKSYQEPQETPSKFDVSLSSPSPDSVPQTEELQKTSQLVSEAGEYTPQDYVETIHSVASIEHSRNSLDAALGEQTDSTGMEEGFIKDSTKRFLISITVLDRSWEISPGQWDFVNQRLARAKQRMEEKSTSAAKDEMARLQERGVSSAATIDGVLATATTEDKDDTSKEDKLDRISDDGRSRGRTVKYGSTKRKSASSREGKQDSMKRNKSVIKSDVTTESNPVSDFEDSDAPGSVKIKSKGKKDKIKEKKSRVESSSRGETGDESKKEDNIRLSAQTDRTEANLQGKKVKKLKKKRGSESREAIRKSIGARSVSEGDIPKKKIARKCRPTIKGIFKFKRHQTANLIIEVGGRHSQRIKHITQPHWILEILTDADQECTIMNNKCGHPPDTVPIKEEKTFKQARQSAQSQTSTRYNSLRISRNPNNLFGLLEEESEFDVTCSDQESDGDDWDYLDFLAGAMGRDSFNNFGEEPEEEEEEEEEEVEEEVKEDERVVRRRQRLAFAETQEEALLVDWILDAMFYADQKCEIIGDNNLSQLKLKNSLTQLKRCDDFSFWDDENGFGKFKDDKFSALDDRNDFLNWISQILGDTEKYLNDKEIFKEIGGMRGSSPISRSQEEFQTKSTKLNEDIFAKLTCMKCNVAETALGSVASSDSSSSHFSCYHSYVDKLSEACRPKSPSALLPKPLCVRKIVSPPPLIFRKEKRERTQKEDRPINFLSRRRKIIESDESESCFCPNVQKCPIITESFGDSFCK